MDEPELLFIELPPEILSHIFKFVDSPTLSSLVLCQSLQEFTCDESDWRVRCLVDNVDMKPETAEMLFDISWRRTHRFIRVAKETPIDQISAKLDSLEHASQLLGATMILCRPQVVLPTASIERIFELCKSSQDERLVAILASSDYSWIPLLWRYSTVVPRTPPMSPTERTEPSLTMRDVMLMLIQRLQGHNPHLVRRISSIIAALCKTDDYAKRLFDLEGGPKHVVSIITNCCARKHAGNVESLVYDKMLTSSLKIAFDLTYDESKCVLFLDTIAPGIILLSDANWKVNAWSAAVFGRLAYDQEAEIMLGQLGSLEALVKLIATSTNARVRQASTRSLCNLTVHPGNARRGIDAQAIPAILALLESNKDPDYVKASALGVILNCLANGLDHLITISKDHVKYILLQTDSPRIKLCSLICVCFTNPSDERLPPEIRSHCLSRREAFGYTFYPRLFMFVPSLRSQPPSDTDIITDLNRDALTLMLLWMLAYGNLGNGKDEAWEPIIDFVMNLGSLGLIQDDSNYQSMYLKAVNNMAQSLDNVSQLVARVVDLRLS